MVLDTVLAVSSIYLALVGLGYLVAPDALTFGTLGAGASAALLGEVRVGASTFLGIAVLNWMARGSQPSKARDAVALGNTVGFGIATVLGIVAIAGGAPTMQFLPTAIALVFTVWFFIAGRSAMSRTT